MPPPDRAHLIESSRRRAISGIGPSRTAPPRRLWSELVCKSAPGQFDTGRWQPTKQCPRRRRRRRRRRSSGPGPLHAAAVAPAAAPGARLLLGRRPALSQTDKSAAPPRVGGRQRWRPPPDATLGRRRYFICPPPPPPPGAGLSRRRVARLRPLRRARRLPLTAGAATRSAEIISVAASVSRPKDGSVSGRAAMPS